MLERQKLLRETDSQRTPNGILRVYEHRKTGEVYLIRDPDIPLSEVEAVQNEVIILLENNGRLPKTMVEETPEEPATSETGETAEPAAESETTSSDGDTGTDEEPEESEEE